LYRMLDLFFGLGGASQAMREDDDWKVTTVDFEERFEPDICEDVMDLEPDDFEDNYDLIWASPPCGCFTVAQIGHSWDNGWLPSRREVVDAVALVYQTLYLINSLDPDYWFLENPRGMLRNIIGKPEGTVTYCQYGENRMKPTDLWGVHPPSFEYRSCSYGDDCHESAPRGSRKSTQGIKKREERAKVPYDLSEAVKESVESPESKDKLEAFC